MYIKVTVGGIQALAHGVKWLMQRPMCQATNGLPDLFKEAKIGFAFFCRIANVQVKQKIYLNQFSS
jgi:hypothetical protein